ncbi:hypothetical protein EJX00_04020 [Enterococcus faecium]|uniref:Uncharacterized protein n=1 Tax=Enterococcus faecium TaxID=1352 RepID=A0AB37VYS7_ENTFC|nr:hypothetical protein [Enterococcus faecium]RXU92289.1 hypothetical protein CYQ77_01215 [Enterococcus faecium]
MFTFPFLPFLFFYHNKKNGAATKILSQSLILNKRCGRDSLSVVIRHISFTASFLRKNRFIRKIPRIHLLHVDLD